MKTNTKAQKATVFTHEGAPARNITHMQLLRRSVLSCLLWEKEYYEDGVQIVDRIKALVELIKDPNALKELAIEARTRFNLRHVPLLLAREMARSPLHRRMVSDTLAAVIQRADELSEFLALYWQDGKCKLAAQVKKGLARAFGKFNEYNLAKYNRDGQVKLRDVMFLCHPKPTSHEQAAVWKKLADKTLPSPDTWEVELSAGKDKKETFTRLIREDKLGALALLRNLRNMNEAGVAKAVIKSALKTADVSRVLPFRFIAAARYAPEYEPELEAAMFRSIKAGDSLSGETIILVDVSGSMDSPLSDKSDMWRIDAACGVAMVAREICEDCQVWTFSDNLVQVAPRRGFALRDAIVASQRHNGTHLGAAVTKLNSGTYNRLIVITDEQSHDKVPGPGRTGYMINVASAQNGVGYGPWVHIDGFSESVIRYIAEIERDEKQ